MKRIKKILIITKDIIIKIILTIPAILVGIFLALPSFIQKLLIIMATPCIDLWFPNRKKEASQQVITPTVEIPEEDKVENHTFY